MPQTHAQIWGTLKRYLTYTAAGFVVLGGVGAMEAARPPLVASANASQALRDSVSAEALLTIRSTTPSWTQRLRFDLASTISVAARQVVPDPIVTPVPTPSYPAPDTAEQTPPEPLASPANPVAAAPVTVMAAVQATPVPAPTTVMAAVQAAPAPVTVMAAVQAAPVAPVKTEEPPPVIVAAAAPVEAAPVPVAVQADAPQAPIAPEPAPQASTTSASSSLVAALDWVYGDSSGAIAANNDATSLETSAAPADIPETTSDLATPIDTLSDVAPVQAVANPDDAIPGERRVIQVQRGDTLFGLLTQAGLSEAEAQAAGHSLSDVFSPSDLKAGQRITLNLASADGSDGSPTPAGKLVGLTLAPSAERDVKLSRDSDGQFVAASVDRPLTERTALAAGQIDTSLFENARDAGVPVALIGDIIKAFSYDVDFQRDIHDGDSFEAVFERFDTTNGDLVKAGRLLYASLTLGDKPLAIYYFERDGDGEYYTSDGQAVRKSLLKTPIDGAKITSGYGMRVNPILGYSMMHQGIDFGAPIGTPIYAAGNGTVEEMGEKNGYGNYMKLRHNGTYETAYGHISRFASGLKRGTKVKQGEVIAYVGETGRATGPHLHFEILVNGAHVNPASVKTVAADKLTGKDLNAFKAQVAAINLQRKTLANRSEIADQSGTAAPLDCSRLHGCQN